MFLYTSKSQKIITTTLKKHFLIFCPQNSCNPPWERCHKSLVNRRKQIVADYFLALSCRSVTFQMYCVGSISGKLVHRYINWNSTFYSWNPPPPQTSFDPCIMERFLAKRDHFYLGQKRCKGATVPQWCSDNPQLLWYILPQPRVPKMPRRTPPPKHNIAITGLCMTCCHT